MSIVNTLRMLADYWPISLPIAGFILGGMIDKYEATHRLAAYKNKSMLFQRELKPGDKEPW